MKKNFWVVAFGTLLLAASSLYAASVPQLLDYQGRLNDSSGAVNGTQNMVFSLYSSATETNALWTETQSVSVAMGIFSAALGSITPLPASVFDSAEIWLGIAVGSDAEMTPRQRITSVGYAMRAGTADGVNSASQIVSTAPTGTAPLSVSSTTMVQNLNAEMVGGQKLSDLDASYQKRYAKVAVVAQSGGDYADPVSAMADLASWCGVPSASNPCLVRIQPGVYSIGAGAVAMQQYVDIEGSGEGVTKITRGPGGVNAMTVQGASFSELRDLTVEFSGGSVAIALYNDNASPTFRNVTASALGAATAVGISNDHSASPRLIQVTAKADATSSSTGITNTNSSSPSMSGVVVAASGGASCLVTGIENTNTTVLLRDVMISLSGGSAAYGISNTSSSVSVLYSAVTVTGSGTAGGIRSATSGTVTVDHSVVTSSGSAVVNLAGVTTRIAESKLVGSVSNAGTLSCYRAYDTAYGELNSSCTNAYLVAVSKTGTGGGTITAGPGGLNCGSTCSASFTRGAAVVLTATPNASSQFDGWTGACSGTGSCNITVDGDKSASAQFSANLVRLAVTRSGSGSGSVTSSPAGVDCGAVCVSSYDQGTFVTLTAMPETYNVFSGWTGACAGTGPCSISLNASNSVTATFSRAKYVLAVSATGNGTVASDPFGIYCGVACSGSFDGGTVVSLTAVPSPGATFLGWSGSGCTGVGACTVTMNSAKTVNAAFAP